MFCGEPRERRHAHGAVVTSADVRGKPSPRGRQRSGRAEAPAGDERSELAARARERAASAAGRCGASGVVIRKCCGITSDSPEVVRLRQAETLWTQPTQYRLPSQTTADFWLLPPSRLPCLLAPPVGGEQQTQTYSPRLHWQRESGSYQ